MIGQSDWLAENWVAVVAAVISGLAALASIAAARRSIAAQNRLLEIEERRERDRVSAAQKARLIARIVREESLSGRKVRNYYLEIENLGASAANNIDIPLDDGPVLDHPTMPRRTDEIRHVGPESSFRYTLAPTLETRPPAKIAIAWDDDSGEPGQYETTLT